MNLVQWVRGLFGKSPKRSGDYSATYGSGNMGGFAGGMIGRLTASMATWSGAVNADLDGNLVVLRARARQLCQSNEHGRRFLSLVATNIVGPVGPTLQVRAMKDQRDPVKPTTLDKTANDAVEIHWARWGKTADITGRVNFAHLCRMTIKAVARDGEALVRIVRRRDLPYGLALQLLESDRLDETYNVQLSSGAIRQGVEVDSTGRALAYWIKSRHPGERFGQGSNIPERVPASDVIHLYLPERGEQLRGYTWLHAIVLRSGQLHGFNEAAVTAARVGASKIAVLEHSAEGGDMSDGLADSKSTGGNLQMNIEAGEMFDLPAGTKLSSWNPEYPHANFESFVKQAMLGISAGLDVANHNLTGDMTGVNYSSARISELSEREQWIVLQGWFIFGMSERIYQEWLAIALLRGDITFEISGKALPAEKLAKFANASRFQGRRWRWVDPANEIKAAQAAVELGVMSRTRIAAEQGMELDDILDELKQEKEIMDAAGLSPPVLPGAPPAPAPAEPPPEDPALKALLLAMGRAALQEHKQGDVHIHNAPPGFTLNQGEVRTDVHVPAQAAQPAPIVNVQNDIHEREQPAPVVNVAAPTVEVTVEAIMPAQTEVAIVSLPERKTTSVISRDPATGDISETTQIEIDL
jgi:lambda family phage portal protein